MAVHAVFKPTPQRKSVLSYSATVQQKFHPEETCITLYQSLCQDQQTHCNQLPDVV